jgi:hypothetical protein
MASLALASLLLLARLPFAQYGYGDDSDSYRVLWAANHLASTGLYEPSRTPGYPLPEYVAALLARFFPVTPAVMNLPANVMASVAFLALARLLLPLGAVTALMVALAFSLTPAVWDASTMPLDYMIGAAFFLIALCFGSRRRIVLAALFLGLAAACRPTYALAYIPVALAVFIAIRVESSPARIAARLLLLALLSGSTTLLFYLPLFRSQGLGWLAFYDDPLSFDRLLARLLHNVAVQGFGLVGSAAILILSLWTLFRLRALRLPDDPAARAAMDSLLVASLLYFLLFLRLASQPYYLIPAIPGLYVLFALSLPRAALLLLPPVMLASSFIGYAGRDARRHDEGFGLHLRGPALRRLDVEKLWDCIAERARRIVESPDERAIVIAGELQPIIDAKLGFRDSPRLVYFVTPVAGGGWRSTHEQHRAPLIFPEAAPFLLIDVAARQQRDEASLDGARVETLDTTGCGELRPVATIGKSASAAQ